MKLLIAGVGPGDEELITLRALNEAQKADVIIVPRSRPDSEGIAEKLITHHLPNKSCIPIAFPMITDQTAMKGIISKQVGELMPKLENVKTIFFPAIGDAMLYSTGKYFIDALREFIHDLDTYFIPGISAHSLAAACAKKFLAMKDEILAIIPGTASSSSITAALRTCDNAAIYKPTAIHNIHELVKGFNIVRVDYAGFGELERVIYGQEALGDIHDYLSIIILWREST